MDNDAMNTTSFCVNVFVFISFGYTGRNGTAGSYGNDRVDSQT